MWEASSLALSAEALTLSKHALIATNRLETFNHGLWKVHTSWVKARRASQGTRCKREPHWLGGSRPLDLEMGDSLTVSTASRISDMGLRRTMMRKEVGEWYEALPGLSRTTPLGVFSEGGW